MRLRNLDIVSGFRSRMSPRHGRVGEIADTDEEGIFRWARAGR